MPELRFDNRVAVVTGAGRGLGRAYAKLLASKGAKVVVNDSGGTLMGDGCDAGPAEEVVGEIEAAGGEAVASTESVATAAGGQAIIQTALDRYGRIDILIHNAGNVRRASLKEMTYEDFDAVLDVHLRGAFNVVRPAFPVMCDAGLRPHRVDVIDRRPVRQPRRRELRGGQGRRHRTVQRRRPGRRRRRGEEQRDRACRSDENGRGTGYIGLPADGARACRARGCLACARIMLDHRRNIGRRRRAGWPGRSSPRPQACTGRLGRSSRSARTLPPSVTRPRRWSFRSFRTGTPTTSATASRWHTVASGPLVGVQRRRSHRDGDGPVLHADHGRHGR